VDTQDYIESGILEQYALGELTEVERAEVERQAAAHPAIQQELDTVMEALAAYAVQELPASAPPAGMRERVLEGWQAAIREQPAASSAPAQPEQEAVVRPMLTSHRDVADETTRINWMMAASVALLLLSVAGNILFYYQWKNAENDLAIALNGQQQMASTMQAVEKRLGQRSEEVAVLRNDEFRDVALKGTDNAPDASARVLFNPTTHTVYLDVRNLPTPPVGKQYQLWALDNGKPIDAGTLSQTTAQGDNLQLMNSIASAQAFAMTVEQIGGSPVPTLSTMAVMGQVL